MNELVVVYSAECMRRLQSRAFWLGLVFGIVGVALMMKLPAFLNSYTAQTKRIVIAAPAALAARAKPLLAKSYTVVGVMPPLTRAPRESDLTNRKTSAIVALSSDARGLHVIVYARDPGNLSTSAFRRSLMPLAVQMETGLTDARIASLLQMPIDMRSVSSKFGTAAQADAARIIAYLLLVLLYILTMVNSQMIMSSVAEEKTSRIAELLVASVSPSALLAGKIASSATLALLQMAVWVGFAFAMGVHPGASPTDDASSMSFIPFSLNGISGTDVLGFALFFLIGYLQMATLFAAAGSLINRTEDLGSVSGPLFIPVIAAFFIAISALAVPDSPAVIVTSFVPLIAPFVMFVRIVVSNPPFWQVALSFVINVAAIWAIAVLGGKIYRIGMLLYGRPPRLSQIINVLRT